MKPLQISDQHVGRKFGSSGSDESSIARIDKMILVTVKALILACLLYERGQEQVKNRFNNTISLKYPISSNLLIVY